jgi:predicted dehydrogenase/threonine dehydrogenase-like Zn-dependent dehydrogenase
MEQLAQNYRLGQLALLTVPAPAPAPREVLVRTVRSLVSAGTELRKVHEAGLSLLGKARARPDQARQVLASVRQLGIGNTYRKVMSRLDSWTPLGYSAAGVVTAVGAEVTDLRVGDRVAIGGAEHAHHAEVNAVPVNLTAAIPDGVSFDDAAYATVGAIAMQACRQANLRFGETAVVIGLGLIGQITARILAAADVRVFGVDSNRQRVDLALAHGAIADGGTPGDAGLADRIVAATGGFGVDAALLAVDTDSNQPVELAVRLVRDRGVITDIGNTRIELPWKDCYAKELDFRFSRSYGPGRYDPVYEEQGVDYPIGYVRWTEQRNMAHFLALLAARKVDVTDLTTLVLPFADAPTAYEALKKEPARTIGVLFAYPEATTDAPPAVATPRTTAAPVSGRLGVAFVGAGNYARSMLLPFVAARSDAQLTTVVTRHGLSAASVAKRFGFRTAATTPDSAWSDADTQLVFIATRHSTHARLAAEALRRGRHVFVEKPLALDRAELECVRAAAIAGGGQLTVGFNRRFAPLARRLAEAMRASRGPWTLTYRVHAGPRGAGSWYDDPAEGGRFGGEAGHFVDLLQYLTDALPVRVFATTPGDDAVVAQIAFADGSVGVLEYLTAGDPRMPKETLAVTGGGLAAELHNFRRLTILRGGRRRRTRAFTVDKGQRHAVAAVIDAARTGGPAPIPLTSLLATTESVIAMRESLASGAPVALEERA